MASKLYLELEVAKRDYCSSLSPSNSHATCRVHTCTRLCINVKLIEKHFIYTTSLVSTVFASWQHQFCSSLSACCNTLLAK